MKKLISLLVIIVLFSSCKSTYKGKMIGFDDDGNCIELPDTKIIKLNYGYNVGDTVRNDERYDTNLYVIKEKF